MGNLTQICNQVTNQNSTIADANLNEFTKKKQYEPIVNQSDQKYNQEIAQLEKHQQIKKTLENRTTWKNANGEVYLGQFVNDVKKGKGVIYKPGKYFYYGQIDHTPNGKGLIKIYQQEILYEGGFKNGRLEGQCKIKKFDNSIVFTGTINSDGFPSDGKLSIHDHENSGNSRDIVFYNYPQNDAQITYNDGRKYKGHINIHSFVPHGKGQAFYPNKSKYSGHWSVGQFHGEGKFTWPDETFYEGSYVLGKKQGKGKFQYPNKKLYFGDWYDGKQQGEGILYSSNGDILKRGIWKDGKCLDQ